MSDMETAVTSMEMAIGTILNRRINTRCKPQIVFLLLLG